MQKLKVISIVFFLMMLLSSLSYAVKIELSDQGTSAKLNGALINGDLTVYIYTTPTGGSPIWQETFTNAIKNGSWNVMLGQNPSNPLELEFGKKYYKDYSIDGTDVDFEDNSGTLQERLEFYSPLGYINNNSLFNFSMIQSCPAGYAVRSVNEDGSVNCEQISSGAIASGWNDTGSVVELVTSTDNVNANTLYISNSLGRVGIGTSSPSSTLHVVGSATITNGLTVSGGTVSLPAGQINDAEISDLSWTKLKNYPAACNAGQAIQALNDTITCINVVESSSGITGSGTANRIAKFTDTQVIGSSGINDLSDAVAITIDSSENVGIGTTSPEKRLHIIGSGTDIPVKIEVNGGSGGKPGIELEDPTAANYGARLYFDDTLNGLQLVTLSNSVENQGIFVTRDNGNVGIGTTSPAYKLDVNGQVRIQTLNAGSTNTVVTHSSGVLQTRTIDSRVWGSSLVDYSGTSANYIPKMSDANTITNSVIYESGGNVGIGTTSPSGKLDVRGDEVRIWSGTGSVNYATGAGDLYVQDTAEVDGDL
ncbi:MAG: mucin9, partial [Candidatus Woesearchaeota archaeon]|nr:mucin9 [Candidatus Woesearchaeota archaeon]